MKPVSGEQPVPIIRPVSCGTVGGTLAPAVVYTRCRMHSVARLEHKHVLVHQKYKAVYSGHAWCIFKSICLKFVVHVTCVCVCANVFSPE